MAHVVLVVEVEASDGEADAWTVEVDSELAEAAPTAERVTAAQDVGDGGKQVQESGAEAVADESLEGLSSGFVEGSANATLDTA